MVEGGNKNQRFFRSCCYLLLYLNLRTTYLVCTKAKTPFKHLFLNLIFFFPFLFFLSILFYISFHISFTFSSSKHISTTSLLLTTTPYFIIIFSFHSKLINNHTTKFIFFSIFSIKSNLVQLFSLVFLLN